MSLTNERESQDYVIYWRVPSGIVRPVKPPILAQRSWRGLGAAQAGSTLASARFLVALLN